MTNVLYMCPVTRKGYSDPRIPRFYELATQYYLSNDEILEIFSLRDELEKEGFIDLYEVNAEDLLYLSYLDECFGTPDE